jgi:hypothetical protein
MAKNLYSLHPKGAETKGLQPVKSEEKLICFQRSEGFVAGDEHRGATAKTTTAINLGRLLASRHPQPAITHPYQNKSDARPSPGLIVFYP